MFQIDSDEAFRLAQMPSMVTQTDPKVYTYILPPIRYPDGRTYLKFGQHDLTRELRTRAEVAHHYRAGPEPGHVSQLVDQARQLLPGLRVLSYRGDSCVTLNTPDKAAPFIDTVLPGVRSERNARQDISIAYFRAGHRRGRVWSRGSEL